MDKLKYTSGEWAIKERGVCIGTDREPICILCYCEERSEGNAQLIRAAPDMYELLKQAKEILFASNPKAEDMNDLWDKIQACLEAIK